MLPSPPGREDMEANSQPRTKVITIIALFALSALLPTTAALAPDLTAGGVGSFLVDAGGLARGAHVTSNIDEVSGTLSGFSVTGLAGGAQATTVFDAVRVDNFQQVRKIEGAGSAALTLVGSNAQLTAADAAGGILLAQATQATSIAYDLPSGVQAIPAVGYAGNAGQALALVDAHGQTFGHLVAVPGVPGDFASSAAFQIKGQTVSAALAQGDAVVFKGIPAHLRGLDAGAAAGFAPGVEQHLRTVHDLSARGVLVTDTISEFSAGDVHDVTVAYRSGVAAASALVGQNAVTTSIDAVKGQAGAQANTLVGQGAVVASHDLDYEVLPIQSAQDVAVYVNGALVKQVPDAGAVAAAQLADVSAAYALVQGGRTQVLTSVSSDALQAAAVGMGAASTITIVDASRFVGAPPALESQAVATYAVDVVGNFESLGHLSDIGAQAAGTTSAQSKFIGRFASGVIAKDVMGATIIDYADLETRTAVFDQVTVVGESLDGGEKIGTAVVQVSSEFTTLRAQDDVYGTAVLTVSEALGAGANQQVAFDLADGLRPTLVTQQVARLDGAHGYVGWLVAAAPSGVGAAGALQLGGSTAAGASDLVATLPAGASLVYMGQDLRTGVPSMPSFARGIADGQIAGHAVFGTAGQAVTFLDADYFGAASSLDVTRAQRGALELTHYASAAAPEATSFLVDARGSSLVASSVDDIHVYVDGAPAVLMGSANAVVDAGFPSYFVDASPQGTLMMIVNAAGAARAPAGADVAILSGRAAVARADAAADLFGAFDVLPDGRAVGSYVQARADHATGTLHDVTVTAPQGATVVFQEVRAGTGGFTSRGASGAAQLVLAKSDVALGLTDQTAAIMTVAAGAPLVAEMVLAQGIAVNPVDGNVMLVSGPNGLMGALTVADAAGRSVAGGSLSLAAPSQVGGAERIVADLNEGGQVLFKSFSGIETELDSMQRLALAQALGAGQIAGQVVVQGPRSTGITLDDGFTTSATTVVSSISGPGLAVQQATTSFASTMDLTTAATTNEITVTLSSALEKGKTVLISLDAGTLPGLASGQAQILFDGVPMKQASSYADVLDATNDGGVAEYFVLTSSVSGASQVLASVPHFSVHTVTLKANGGDGGNVFVWMTIGLAVVVIAESAWLLGRRRMA